MARKMYPAKDPDEQLAYGFNWTPRNIGTEQIVEASLTVTIMDGTVDHVVSKVQDVPGCRAGQGTVHIFSGGTPGEVNEILIECETDAVPPSILQQTVYLPIREK